MHKVLPIMISMIFAASLACEDLDEAGNDANIPPFEPCTALDGNADQLIEVQGENFILDGSFVVPHGVNSYPLLQHVGNNRLDAVRDIFDQANDLGRPLVRTNAFIDGGDNPARVREDDGTIREQGLVALDKLVAEAGDNGVKLLLTLTNNWPDYGGAKAVVDMVAPDEGLPKDAFWSEPRALESQRVYIRTILGRANTITGRIYSKDPTIFGWELANEARCTEPAWCDEGTLVEWARDMAETLKQAGALQPIVWGGSGYVGKYGENLESIAEDGAVDILTLHLYPHETHPDLHNLPTPERIQTAIEVGAETIRDRVDIAISYSMPLLLEEFGWLPPEAGDKDAERGTVERGWLAVAHDEGIASLPWMIGEQGRTDYDGFLIERADEATIENITCD
jgi:mannan endo-1,4-beta-mannosidase